MGPTEAQTVVFTAFTVFLVAMGTFILVATKTTVKLTHKKWAYELSIIAYFVLLGLWVFIFKELS